MKINQYMGYIFLISTIISTVVSQLLVKWRVANHIVNLLPMPNTILGKILFIFKVLFDPIIFIACCFLFVSGLSWIATMTKFDISYAYPFTMLGFVAVLILSALLLGEQFNIYKVIGCSIIIAGVIVTSRGL